MVSSDVGLHFSQDILPKKIGGQPLGYQGANLPSVTIRVFPREGVGCLEGFGLATHSYQRGTGEKSPVRGCFFSPEDCSVCPSVYETFKVFPPVVMVIFGLIPGIKGTVQCAFTEEPPLCNGAGGRLEGSLKAPP